MNLNNIPDLLKETGKFCLWKYEERDGKRTKVPYQANGKKANSANSKTFCSYNDIVSITGYDGIGIGIFGSIGAIDIDHCINNGVISEFAKEIIETVHSYTEVSPSGTGIRIMLLVKNVSYDKQKYYINNRKLGMELYIPGSTNRFVTITGDHLKYDLRDASKEIMMLAEKYMKKHESKSNGIEATGSSLSDDQVKDKCKKTYGNKFTDLWTNNSKYHSHSEADLALCNYLCFFSGGDYDQIDRLFRQSELMRPKWDEKRGAHTYGYNTITKAIQNATAFYSPDYNAISAKEDFNGLDISSYHLEKNVRYPWNDVGFSNLFADVFNNQTVYVAERKCWFVFDGKRWVSDIEDLKVMELCKKLANAVMVYALGIQDEKLRTQAIKMANKWQTRRTRLTILHDAESIHTAKLSDFDKDKYMFNCLNGTLNLLTGEFNEHASADLITKLANVTYDQTLHSDRWDQFIDEIMSNNQEKIEYLQQALGYALSGDTSCECLFFLYGATTRNGKGTLMESIVSMMGDYAAAVRPETIMLRKNASSQGPSEDLARLAGVRLANIAEPAKGIMLNSAQVKAMTGNDKINARFLHENSFDYYPQFKLYINTNYLPNINDMTLFTSHRIVIIPFERHFEPNEQDRSLKAYFQQDDVRSAILNWLYTGYRSFSKHGLFQPQIIEDSINNYFHESDKLGQFIEEMMEKGENLEVKTSKAYEEYGFWCDKNGYFRDSQRNFVSSLRSRLIVKRKRPKGGGSAVNMIIGYGIRQESFLD